MDIKKITICGIIFLVIQAIINTGIFVTFPQMTTYAASKDSIAKIEAQLARIETKIDKLIMGY